MVNICAPALIYVAFSLTQIVIDTFKGLYNTAFFKVIVMIIITILLNALCQGGMTIISWIIVFVPFMFMSLIVGILLYVFGLDAATGTLNIKCDQSKETPLDKVGNLIYTIEDTKNTNNSNSNGSNGTMDVSYSEAPYGTTDPEFN
jgi:small-conductance mechanosensitive channel